MGAFLYFRRRRRVQSSATTVSVLDHRRDESRRGPEKRFTTGNSLLSAERPTSTAPSEEPILEAVFDGFPGSTGYDDVRSLDSIHSGEWQRGPNQSQQNEASSAKDELTAARLNSGPVIVSYGPNRVTPTLPKLMTLSTRTSEFDKADDSVSIDSREDASPVTRYRSSRNYNSYTPPPPSQRPPATPKPARPIIVSYGPNRVTPTPDITTPTIPPDDHALKAAKLPHAVSALQSARERAFSFEGDDDFNRRLGLGSMGLAGDADSGGGAPLPPYASSADFVAMEKGAIKKLPEPQAMAELPPTKDGYYHFTADSTEHELPGVDQLLPHRPYDRRFRDGPSSAAGRNRHDIDEQKFLLSDVEMAELRAQKAKIRQRQQQEQQQKQQQKAQQPQMQEGKPESGHEGRPDDVAVGTAI